MGNGSSGSGDWALRTSDSSLHLLSVEGAMPNMEKQVQVLTNYLWSRHLPVEPEELQRRAVLLEKKILENAGRS